MFRHPTSLGLMKKYIYIRSFQHLPHSWPLQPTSNLCAQHRQLQNSYRKFSFSALLSFRRADHGPFVQESACLYNPFEDDLPLQRFLRNNIPLEAYNIMQCDLHDFGERIVSEIYNIGLECEQQLPHLTTYDVWGKRVDKLWTCNAWKEQRKISAEEGLVAIGYERKFHAFSRLHQISKLYLYSPVAGLYTCPLAMTDGAAKTIQELGLQKEMFANAFKRLTSRDSSQFWTSGQWMTERRGGSDVEVLVAVDITSVWDQLVELIGETSWGTD